MFKTKETELLYNKIITNSIYSIKYKLEGMVKISNSLLGDNFIIDIIEVRNKKVGDLLFNGYILSILDSVLESNFAYEDMCKVARYQCFLAEDFTETITSLTDMRLEKC